MGTNYYLYIGRKRTNPIHIGKSSYGWRFNLHYIPNLCENIDDWMLMLSRPGRHIENEYGGIIRLNEMVEVIFRRGCRYPNHPYCTGTDHFDPSAYDIYTDWDPYNRLCRYNIRTGNVSGCVQSLPYVTYDMTKGEYS